MDPRGFPTTLPEFQRVFPDDAACARYLEHLRWPRGFMCMKCENIGEPYRFAKRRSVVLRCRACQTNVSLMAGTGSMIGNQPDRQGINKRPDARASVTWHVAIRPGEGRALDKGNEADAMIDKTERLKAGVRAKVEHRFRVIKRQFGFVKVALSWFEEKHGTALHAVCAVQPVDGVWGLSAPKNRASALQREKKWSEWAVKMTGFLEACS